MSDLTTLLLWLHARCRMVAFHGPVVARRGGWSKDTWRHLIEALEGRTPSRPQRPRALTAVAPGVAEGPLLGGNLTILSHSIGTSWQPDLRGAILFLEEVNERYFRVDRKITHLRTAGLLHGVAGVLVGQVHKSGEKRTNGFTLADVLADLLGDLGVPVLMGYPAGHARANRTLPIGARVRIDAGHRSVTFLEQGVTAA
jgi:muramoyltetrapeptide carboxypeptidase